MAHGVVGQVAHHPGYRLGTAPTGRPGRALHHQLDPFHGGGGYQGLHHLIQGGPQIEGGGGHPETARLQPPQQEHVIDQRVEGGEVVLHGAQVTGRIRSNPVDQRLHRSLEGGQRGTKIVPDVAQQHPALLFDAVAFAFEAIEAGQHLVDSPGRLTQLVAPADAAAYRQVARFHPFGHRGQALDVGHQGPHHGHRQQHRETSGDGQHHGKAGQLLSIQHHEFSRHRRRGKGEGQAGQRHQRDDQAQGTSPTQPGPAQPGQHQAPYGQGHESSQRRQGVLAEQISEAGHG